MGPRPAYQSGKMEVKPWRYNRPVEGITMLTDDQVTELRGKVERANRHRADKRFTLARCTDEPLKGLPFRLEPHEAQSRTIIVGWSLPTPIGPILAYYGPGDKAGELRFREYSAPGRRESGLSP